MEKGKNPKIVRIDRRQKRQLPNRPPRLDIELYRSMAGIALDRESLSPGWQQRVMDLRADLVRASHGQRWSLTYLSLVSLLDEMTKELSNTSIREQIPDSELQI